MPSVADLRKGQVGVIRHIEESELNRGMLTLGILPNKKIKLIRKAPLGDCLYLEMEFHHLALRLSEAKKIIVDIEES